MMTAKIVGVAVIVWFGLAGAAFAQTGRTASTVGHAGDPLDVFNQRASQVTRTAAPTRRISSDPAVSASRTYAGYMEQYRQYLADYARFQEAQRSSGPRWMDALQGISAGLQVADQAIGVYEHAVEAKALTNLYRTR